VPAATKAAPRVILQPRQTNRKTLILWVFRAKVNRNRTISQKLYPDRTERESLQIQCQALCNRDLELRRASNT
jgi:hypothetical protein